MVTLGLKTHFATKYTKNLYLGRKKRIKVVHMNSS